ncbi:NADH ubiquinone oxidoreductase subunit NDUFA12-domain-containing protein [Spinellus fusiger]|nr:NADH ubiquinone oxidoreductase subunit NDUFA12-domain-containing protein [Spinellus fusiger]
MSTFGRTLKNIIKVGPANALKQMNTIGDIKWGLLVGTDVNGNKYFESQDEVSGRERWVEYASDQPDSGDIDPLWSGWMTRKFEEPPTEWTLETKKFWGEPTPNFTGTYKAFKTYNTTVPKFTAWEPTVKERV